MFARIVDTYKLKKKSSLLFLLEIEARLDNIGERERVDELAKATHTARQTARTGKTPITKIEAMHATKPKKAKRPQTPGDTLWRAAGG